MQKQLKTYFKDIKKNLPCCNKVICKMLDDLKTSVKAFIEENGVTSFAQIEQHFGTAEDVAKEFAIGIDDSLIKSYKFKKRVTAIVLSILATILVIVASLAIYIVVQNEIHTPVAHDNKITYEYSEEYKK